MPKIECAQLTGSSQDLGYSAGLRVWLSTHTYFVLRKYKDRVGIYIPTVHESYQHAMGWFDPPFAWPATQEQAEEVARQAAEFLFGLGGTYGPSILNAHYWGPEDRPPLPA